MERQRGRQRGQGRVLVAATGIALASLWLVGGPSAGAAAAPLPVVTVTTIQNGVVVVDGVRPCSDVISASVQPAQLLVTRTGPTDTALTVHYTSHPSAGGENDYEPLSGEVVIPAGASTATIVITPKYADGPAPLHVHRSSLLTNVLQNESGYDLGAAAKASVRLRFDIAVFECVPVTPVTTPTVPPTTPPATVPATTATTQPAPAATLPFTGSSRTPELIGFALILLGLGMAGVRYGRPRRLRIRAGWR